MREKLFITLLIVILLLVYAYLGIDYVQQRQEHETLTAQISDATQALTQMPEPPQDLKQRLASAQASLSVEQSSSPDKVNSTQVINTVLNLADECKVRAIPLITQPWSKENADGHSYYVFRLNVAVKGSFSQLVSFISKLENDQLTPFVVENLSVNKVTEQSEEETIPDGNLPVTARLNLAIYALSPTNN